MQAEIISYDWALARCKMTKVSNERSEEKPFEGSDIWKLNMDIGPDWINESVKPKFKFRKESNFFTIGSCFARNIEQALSENEYNILSDTDEFYHKWRHKTQKDWSKGLSLVYLNKYITPSMAAEIEWAVNPPAAERHPAVIESRPKHWIDICASNFLSGDSEADVRSRRDIISKLMNRVFDADVFIITLGLTESWYDFSSGLYFNDPAPWLGIKDASNRVEFRNIGYEENLAALNTIYDVLNKYSRRDVKIICTVSPVPLGATYSGSDILVANSYSKCLLRAVAEEFCQRKNVQYFPSYEFVINSPKQTTWEKDRRHVSTVLVRKIMESFIKLYML